MTSTLRDPPTPLGVLATGAQCLRFLSILSTTPVLSPHPDKPSELYSRIPLVWLSANQHVSCTLVYGPVYSLIPTWLSLFFCGIQNLPCVLKCVKVVRQPVLFCMFCPCIVHGTSDRGINLLVAYCHAWHCSACSTSTTGTFAVVILLPSGSQPCLGLRVSHLVMHQNQTPIHLI